MVFRFLLSLTKNNTLAEELTQETFYKAMKGIKGFQKKSKGSTWLCQIAKNTYYSYLRGSQRLTHDAKGQECAEDGLSHLLRQESVEALHHALHTLPEPYKEVFTLRIFAELGYQQIATLFDKNENWVRVTFYRAKMKMKQLMEEENNE